MNSRYYLLLIFSLSPFYWLPAQSSLPTETPEFSIWFDQQISPLNSGFLNGKEYQPQIAYRSHPFFLGREGQNGSLQYEGQKYAQIDMTYDIFQDKILLRKIASTGFPIFIEMIQNRVQGFELEGHRFIRVEETSFDARFIRAGFYEVLWKGQEDALWFKWQKVLKVVSRRSVFQEEIQIFFLHKSQAYKIKNKKDFIDIFPSHKEAILNYIKQNQLKIQASYPEDLKVLCTFCESL